MNVLRSTNYGSLFCNVYSAILRLRFVYTECPKKHRQRIVCCAGRRTVYFQNGTPVRNRMVWALQNIEVFVPHVNKPNICNTSSRLHYKRGLTPIVQSANSVSPLEIVVANRLIHAIHKNCIVYGTYFCNSMQQIGKWFSYQGFDLAVECMKQLLDVCRGEFYDFKNKQNEQPTSPGILCRVAYSRYPRPLAL